MILFRFIITSSFLFLSLTCFTQTAEKIQVHFDKPFYVSGEDAWYKIYFKNQSAEIQSKVVRVEWLSPDGQIVMQQKLKVENNYAVGDLAIPYDWSEGNYLFRAYTLWGLNFGENQVFQLIIPVYNLLETPAIAEQPREDLSVLKATTQNANALQIEVITDKEKYNKRDQISLSLQLKDAKGNPVSGHFSIAVRDGNYLKLEETLKWTEMGQMANFVEKYAPENGLSLAGNLLDKSGKPLDTRFLSIYFPKKKIFEKTTVSKGQLTLAIPEFYGSQAIQFFDMNPFHEPIPTLKEKPIQLKSSYQAKPLLRSEQVANYLFLLSKYRQYRETFNMPTPNYGALPKVEKKIWESDKAWDMEKYTALSDLASFVAEIIPEGKVDGKGKDRSIRLKYDEKSIFNRLSPWYLVNDWLTEDEKIVLQLPFREVEKIEMFNSKKRIASQLDPSMVSRGLLSIQTKDGKTPDELIKKPNNIEIKGFYPVRQFPEVANADKNIPNFRPIIYWNPSVETNINGRATIRFKTTDAIGEHQIFVVGQSENGTLGTTQLSYEVSYEE